MEPLIPTQGSLQPASESRDPRTQDGNPAPRRVVVDRREHGIVQSTLSAEHHNRLWRRFGWATLAGP